VIDDAEPEHSSCSAMSDKTVPMIRSLEDSLAHWRTLTSGDAIEADPVHQ